MFQGASYLTQNLQLRLDVGDKKYLLNASETVEIPIVQAVENYQLQVQPCVIYSKFAAGWKPLFHHSLEKVWHLTQNER